MINTTDQTPEGRKSAEEILNNHKSDQSILVGQWIINAMTEFAKQEVDIACKERDERLNASSLLYKDSMKEIEAQINEKVHWFKQYQELKQQLESKENLIKELQDKIAKLENK